MHNLKEPYPRLQDTVEVCPRVPKSLSLYSLVPSILDGGRQKLGAISPTQLPSQSRLDELS